MARTAAAGTMAGIRIRVRAFTTPPRKAKRQYLLTLQVSRYCLLALQITTDRALSSVCRPRAADADSSCSNKDGGGARWTGVN